MPVIKASGFTKDWVIDGDQYQATGHLGWGSTNVFWRQIRNLVVDLTDIPSSLKVGGIHWPVGQATSLQNIVVKMSTAADTKHQGVFIEEGSGGFANDLVFYGGAQAMAIGNQQFTMRNLTFYNSQVAILQAWDWGWTYRGLSINNCGVGIDMTGAKDGNVSVSSVTIIDSDISNTPVGIVYGNVEANGPQFGNNIALENIRLNNVPVAIKAIDQTVLAGSAGKSTIGAWGRGNKYSPASSNPTNFQEAFTANSRPASLVSGTDYYERSKPQYENIPLSQMVSVRDAGAVGDGVTDDTAAINAILASAAAAGKVVIFDAGYYVVTSTVVIPPGSRIVGEAYPVILSQGAFFNDMSAPKPVVQVGTPGSTGIVEWSDMIVSTRGAQAGAVLIEWNLSSPSGTPSGMWDVHTRIGGFKGSNLQLPDCPVTANVAATAGNIPQKCIAAFMSMHITKSASGLYMENVWLWVADHDIEDGTAQITIYAGRGLLIESTAGSIWAWATAVEHHALYEYNLVGTKDIVLGQLQTETAYYQPNPDATIPFPTVKALSDPSFGAGESGWGLIISQSSDVLVYGAGLYSFFKNNDNSCAQKGQGANCQARNFAINQSQRISVYNLNTVGTNKLITIDGTDLIRYEDNDDAFVQSVALFRNW
jgi:hypothetical protein